MTSKLRFLFALVQREFRVCRIVAADERTPRLSKVLLAIALGYAVVPLDLIPNLIPVIGLVDDVVIVTLLVAVAYRNAPRAVVIEGRSRAIETAG